MYKLVLNLVKCYQFFLNNLLKEQLVIFLLVSSKL